MLLHQSSNGNRLWECTRDFIGVVLPSVLAEWPKGSSSNKYLPSACWCWSWTPASPCNGLIFHRKDRKQLEIAHRQCRKKKPLNHKKRKAVFHLSSSGFKDLHQFAKVTFIMSVNILCFILSKKWKSYGRTSRLLESCSWLFLEEK